MTQMLQWVHVLHPAVGACSFASPTHTPPCNPFIRYNLQLYHSQCCHSVAACSCLCGPFSFAHVQDLAHTVRTRLAEQARFDAPKRPPHSFSVDHYAGKVTYSTLLLMDKNKDFVIAEHAALLKASGFQFAR